MIDKISRKITFLLGLTVLSVLSLWILGFRLGLDLQGGTRLVYSVDFERAAEEGLVTREELADKGGLVTNLINIWRERIDPTGVRGATIRSEGENRIVIELPGSASAVGQAAALSLAEELAADHQALTLAGNAPELEGFPEDGGILDIAGEKVRYGMRRGPLLSNLSRGLDGTARAVHPAGALVKLQASDPWRALIENTGRMSFLIQAKSSDLTDADASLSSDIEKERAAMTTWVAEHPEVPISEYNRALAARPGPVARLRWYPMRADSEQALKVPLAERVQPLILEENTDWRFEGGDLRAVTQSVDDMGLPAVGFEMQGPRKGEFADFTDEHKDELMAIVISDEIVSMPVIEEKLPGGGIIRGNFTSREVQDLIQVLRSGSLRLAPTFEAQESVGATLGNDYVRRGAVSAAIGLVAVLLFVLFYYGRLGRVAALALFFNLVILMGAMAFIQATLTLPGVAGIILTVGMAVDANILIYERIREEQARGRKPLQSARDGFANAFSTIVDSNLTTLITGLILMKVGTGPVRGFATTLCIGIITSMIAALVLAKLLVHFQLEKGVEAWKMRSMVKETHISFLSKTRVAVVFSLVVCGASLLGFIGTPDTKKLGIDFLGGTTMVVRTAEAMTSEDMRAMFDPASNARLGQATEFTTAVEISPILNSKDGDGYRAFRINSKGKSESGNLGDIRSQVENWLADVLASGPVEDLLLNEGTASGVLYFEKSHEATEVASGLAQIGIDSASVSVREDGTYQFSGQVVGDVTAQDLGNRLQVDLPNHRDGAGNTFDLASPIGELNSVGAQVVTELRDQAVVAILLSLFAAVMYIRMRFAEYSFGFAAVIALVHDVIVTLGAVALGIATGWVQIEINLAMIAAILTIIGYSLNDTIVIFDRVRENRPRMSGSFREILDVSINQTLSRTMLTSLTTLITVLLLFVFNVGTGNVIEGFSFALIVGIVAGTYSTIFIACPALAWLESRRKDAAATTPLAPQSARVQHAEV